MMIGVNVKIGLLNEMDTVVNVLGQRLGLWV
jgi:hypothetical protein